MIFITDKELADIQQKMMNDLTNEESLKDEIKEFAQRNAHRIMTSSTAQVVDSFHDQEYLLSARSYMSPKRKIQIDVRARPWISSLLAVNGGVPDKTKRAKTAHAEFDDTFTMEELVAKMLTALFYNINGLMPEPEALG